MLIKSFNANVALRRISILIGFCVTITFYCTWKWNFQIPGHVRAGSFSTQHVAFWQHLGTSLEDARPPCPPIQINNDIPLNSSKKFEPLDTMKPRLDRLNLPPVDEQSLLRAHYVMRTSAQRLSESLPFTRDSVGIVTTANPKYMPVLLVSLRMLRKTGSTLPVEVFVGSKAEYDHHTCEHILRKLNARCRIISNIYEKAPGVKPLQHFQFKIFSILFSSFQHVLFLDADAFPVNDPSSFFKHAPYSSHGLVTWPDYWANTASAHFFHIAGIPDVPVSTRLSSESGQVLLNKGVHRLSLLMMVYYNYFGPEYYYPLLSQGGDGMGDKETYIHAAMAVDAPFYQVKRILTTLGAWRGSSYNTRAMAQYDPAQDFNYKSPHLSHAHMEKEWHQDDASVQSSAPASPTSRATRDDTEVVLLKFAFIHQRDPKLDPSKIMTGNGPIVDGATGKLARMWDGAQEWEDSVGYDLEKRVWEALEEEGCRKNRRGKRKDEEACRRIKIYRKTVFGKEWRWRWH
jgi:alpha 1,2-mannosyltransferase